MNERGRASVYSSGLGENGVWKELVRGKCGWAGQRWSARVARHGSDVNGRNRGMGRSERPEIWGSLQFHGLAERVEERAATTTTTTLTDAPPSTQPLPHTHWSSCPSDLPFFCPWRGGQTCPKPAPNLPFNHLTRTQTPNYTNFRP